METRWLEELADILPENRLLTTLPDRFSYSFDASFGEFLPEAVVQVMSTEEVAAIIKVADQYEIPVTPRGQSTSLSGGPLPVQGGIVLDFALWSQKVEVDEENRTVTVSPGVLTADINQACEPYGLLYPPDPSSAHVSTIGGNLAENSGGPRGLKYGVTKNFVLGLEVVTPKGDVIQTGQRAGDEDLDITTLIVGSEGTLGVITEAMLKLIPKPQTTKTMMAVFDDIVDAGAAISKTLTSGIFPSKMELMDEGSIVAVENYQPSGLPADAKAVILIELDGHADALEEEAEEVSEIVKSVGARETKIAENVREAEQIWTARKMVSPAISQIKPTKISEDATVPRSKIPEMMEKLHDIRDRYDINLVVFGHAGDGNLHPDVLADKRDSEEMQRVEKAVAEMFTAAIELGGTLSGEHGIGTMKAPFLEEELGAEGVEMMKRLKKAWDPKNMMNPGKIFAESGAKLELTDG
ncbi:glycolate oxidase [Geomicrobium halophilum]|uniref:Glycolate oxidase n=1 Tax=Geomicrobium halophilum TaxID=549000 RepID=A0A841PUD8_9BACL|nr:FAD-linked oxidase C-terminal domain-containing protein [Geomicrobium halophilum]MBB6450766.1 glycolate oxidase [Geomicrobium halophilum]